MITADMNAEPRRRRAAGDAMGMISERVLDKRWGVREFSIRDPDSNQLRFGRPSSGGAPRS
ncbi:MAG TPA: hypothetical protein VG228_05795 [Solirubrobacteraceae bacterium]|jgi:hypothetical protein|nr:hypothetical protein [Solirubrobacteraceae bacterium]